MFTAPIFSILVRRSRTISSGGRTRAAAGTAASRPSPASCPSRASLPSSSSGVGASSTAFGLASNPSASICPTSAATSSSEHCTVSWQDVERCERSDSAVPVCTASWPASSRTDSSARRASRMRNSCASNCVRSSCDASSASRTRSFNSSKVRTSSSSWRSDSTIAARNDALLELARRFFEALHLDRQPAAPLHQRRVVRLGFGGDPRLVAGGLARLEQLPLCRRELFVRAALLGLDALDRLARFLFALSLGAQFLFGAAPLDGNLVLLARDAFSGVAGPRDLQVVADDRLFL